MAIYKVLQDFRDIETKEVYEAGNEIEMTVKRADEAIKTLKEYDGEFLERIDNKEDEDEKLKRLEAEQKAKEEAEAKAKAEKDAAENTPPKK